MAEMKKEYNLIKEMKRLKSIRGSGTQLISVYIPAGYQISEVVAKLRNEYSQSGNIKSKTTRTNVLSAIDKIMQYLKLFKQTPPNGLAVFCGNISDNPSRDDIELFSIETPLPLKVNIYRCDSDFLLDPIEEMIAATDTYALVVMDGREATLATLKGPQIRVVKRLNSTAHAKVRKGGQSAARYERIIEESIGEYEKRIGEAVNALFAQSEFKIKGLLVGGPGPAKEGFVKAGALNYQIKMLGVFDTGYTDDFGLHELVEKAKDLLKEQEASRERQVIEKFMQERSRNALAVSGYFATRKAVENKQASQVIINKDLNLYEEKRESKTEKEIIVVYKSDEEVNRKNASGRGLIDFIDISGEMKDPYLVELRRRIDDGELKDPKVRISEYNELVSRYPDASEVKDAIEKLVDDADENDIDTVFVSSESSYGKEFLMGFGGIAALLKYK